MRRAWPRDAFPMLYIQAARGNILHDLDGDMAPLDEFGYVPRHRRGRLLGDLQLETHSVESVVRSLDIPVFPVEEQVDYFWMS